MVDALITNFHLPRSTLLMLVSAFAGREFLLSAYRAAIDAGYTKAFTAIFDSNVTTFITGVILFQFGSGPVQGFALTLMIGIVASLFCAMIISRVILNVMIEKYGARVSFG